MFPKTYSFDCPSCCPTHPGPQALYYLTLGEFLRHRDLTSGESSALTQTVEVSTRLELIALALLALSLCSRCAEGEKGREREDEDSSGTEREDED
eukprot:2139145-Rhodomonas_salina.1